MTNIIPYENFWNHFGGIIYKRYIKFLEQNTEYKETDNEIPFILISFKKREKKNWEKVFTSRLISVEKASFDISTKVANTVTVAKVRKKKTIFDKTNTLPRLNVQNYYEPLSIEAEEYQVVEVLSKEIIQEEIDVTKAIPIQIVTDEDYNRWSQSISTQTEIKEVNTWSVDIPRLINDNVPMQRLKRLEMDKTKKDKKLFLREEEIHALRAEVFAKDKIIKELTRDIAEIRMDAVGFDRAHKYDYFEKILMCESKSSHVRAMVLDKLIEQVDFYLDDCKEDFNIHVEFERNFANKMFREIKRETEEIIDLVKSEQTYLWPSYQYHDYEFDFG